jgi:hypothetical protein
MEKCKMHLEYCVGGANVFQKEKEKEIEEETRRNGVPINGG